MLGPLVYFCNAQAPHISEKRVSPLATYLDVEKSTTFERASHRSFCIESVTFDLSSRLCRMSFSLRRVDPAFSEIQQALRVIGITIHCPSSTLRVSRRRKATLGNVYGARSSRTSRSESWVVRRHKGRPRRRSANKYELCRAPALSRFTTFAIYILFASAAALSCTINRSDIALHTVTPQCCPYSTSINPEDYTRSSNRISLSCTYHFSSFIYHQSALNSRPSNLMQTASSCRRNSLPLDCSCSQPHRCTRQQTTSMDASRTCSPAKCRLYHIIYIVISLQQHEGTAAIAFMLISSACRMSQMRSLCESNHNRGTCCRYYPRHTL
jgi:hypothetical protein